MNRRDLRLTILNAGTYLDIDEETAEELVPVIVAFVAEWITDRPGLLPVQPEDLARRWREEMT